MRACAHASETSFTCNTLSSRISAAYCCAPVTRSTAPRRGREVPNDCHSVYRLQQGFSPVSARCELNCTHDAAVTAAPAQVPGEPFLDLVFTRVRISRQQISGRDDHPGNAEPALHGAVSTNACCSGSSRSDRRPAPRWSGRSRHRIRRPARDTRSRRGRSAAPCTRRIRLRRSILSCR